MREIIPLIDYSFFYSLQWQLDVEANFYEIQLRMVVTIVKRSDKDGLI